MDSHFEILAVIPARGGSKGIPRKNIRLLNGKPLISYTIETALNSDYITDVVVTTDSLEIADIAQEYGAKIMLRGEELSSDLVTLDPVVYDAKMRLEQKRGKKYDVVITIQPTSPLLQKKTLDKAIQYFFEGSFDTVISAVNKPHLAWGRREDGNVFPLYKERKNRQELPPQYMETGAFLIARSSCVKRDTRIGKNVSIYECPDKESIDIDDSNDWLLTERLLTRKRILFRVDGYKKLGLGHIYNCITMAFSMMEHEILLVTKADAEPGISKLKETHLPFKIFRTGDELWKIAESFHPDIWVNDCLDTDAKYIKKIRKLVPRVITIEDLGSGTMYADAVINALYGNMDNDNRKNVYSGYQYVCLREEFQMEHPKKFSQQVHNIVIMFGGTDPSNLNYMVYSAILSHEKLFQGINFYFVTGIGYDTEKSRLISRPDKNIFVCSNEPRVTKYLKRADLAIISRGRSIYEVACMGVPAIVLSQNTREMTHTFASLEHGFLDLGLGKNVGRDAIANTIDWLLRTPIVRHNMRELMLKVPLRDGVDRVKRIILGE